MKRFLHNSFAVLAIAIVSVGFWISFDTVQFISQVNVEIAYAGGTTSGGTDGCCGGGSLEIPVWYVSEGGGGGFGGYTPPQNNPVSCTVSASETSVSEGDEVTFNWTSTGANKGKLSYDGTSLGNASPLSSGSITIPVNDTGTFVGRFSNNTNTAVCSVKVIVESEPEIPECTLDAFPDTIELGETAALEWLSWYATSASIDNGVGTVTPVDGGVTNVSPVETTTYKMTVEGDGGTAYCSETITVTPPQSEPPTCELEVTPSVIAPWDEVTVDWSSTNADTAQWVPGGDKADVDGSTTFNNITEDTTFTIKFSGPGGEVSCSDSVVVEEDEYAPYCGDGIVNQAWEACDGGASCTAQCQNQCVEMSFARVVVDDVQNDTGGDLTSDIFLGSDSNKIPEGSWFLVHDGSSYETDSDIISYGDVPGIAIQRMVGKIRARIVGSHSLPNTLKEHATGYIETFQANVTGQENDPTPGAFYGMEKPFDGVKAINPHKDELWTVGDTKSYFFSTVTQYDDGWITLIETDAPACSVDPKPACTLTADPTSITEGEFSKLSWVTLNADSASIDNGIGGVTPIATGDEDVSPTSTTQYTMTVTGPGGVATCSAEVGVLPDEPNAPWCSLSVSPTNITTGEQVTLSWSSLNVSEGTVNGNVGEVSPVGGGSVDLFPSDDFEYVGTFTGDFGTTTCSATVTVSTGGCTSCGGGGFDQPTTLLFKKPGEQPLAFVSLSQVPYTGFEAGPMLTALFWFAVILWSMGITYVVLGRKGMQLIAAKVFSYRAPTPETQSNGESVNMTTREDEYANGFSASTTSPASGPLLPMEELVKQPTSTVTSPTPVDQTQQTETVEQPTQPAMDGIPEIEGVIEARAHSAGVLLSPEALSQAKTLGSNREETLKIFGELLNDAVRTIPREDGWILLSSDRFDELKKKYKEATPANEESHEPQAIGSVISETLSESIHTRLASSVLSGDRDTAFTLVKSAEKEGIVASKLITGVVNALDSIIKSRASGESADMILSENASHLSDEALKELVDIFAHALETDYASPYTGVKLALAQAFEVS